MSIYRLKNEDFPPNFKTYVYTIFTFALVLIGFLSHFCERYLYFYSSTTPWDLYKKICHHASLHTMPRWLHCISVPEELRHGSSLVKFCLAKVVEPCDTWNCHDTACETGSTVAGADGHY